MKVAHRYPGVERAVMTTVHAYTAANNWWMGSEPKVPARSSWGHDPGADLDGRREDPLVSSDIVGDSHAAVVDLELTNVRGRHARQGDGVGRQRMGLHPPDDLRGSQHPRRGRQIRLTVIVCVRCDLRPLQR